MQRSLLIAFLCLSPAGVAQNAPAHFSRPAARPQAGTTAMLPVTTTSAQARALYQQAMTDSMNFHLDRALGQWRAAVKLDPNFALAHLMIAFRSQHPKEARAALQRANTAVRRGSYGERLFVRWITGIREGNFLSGIAAMNDLIARYPFDKQLLSLAGNWLMGGAEDTRRAFASGPGPGGTRCGWTGPTAGSCPPSSFTPAPVTLWAT